MAARKRRVTLSDDWKKKIQASQIVNRLYSHIMGEVAMEATQINAAKIILAKMLPDLERQELTGEDGGPVKIQPLIKVTFDD